MKPSQRIDQIYLYKLKILQLEPKTLDECNTIMGYAIKEYLDEEWQKEQKIVNDRIREAAKKAAGL